MNMKGTEQYNISGYMDIKDGHLDTYTYIHILRYISDLSEASALPMKSNLLGNITASTTVRCTFKLAQLIFAHATM